MKVILLGSGLVGAPMAKDLSEDPNFDVTVADINPESLSKIRKQGRVSTIEKDLSNPENVRHLVRDFDYVINALPGHLGFQTLKAVLEAKKNVIDISFFPEDAFELDSLAKSNGVMAITDCGVAPGMSNILVGHAHKLLDQTDTIRIYVGGLPEAREWPFEYKASFSPSDVIEEYIRPARYVENGNLKEKPALSDVESISFDCVGKLEAFLTDGLRTLVKTIRARSMVEKTLRYPGHLEKIKMLRDTGFFNKEKISVNGMKVRPIDLAETLLFPKWKLNDSDKDITVMRVIVEGEKNKKQIRYVYELFDRYDEVKHVHSMARTTGYTATVALRLVASGLFQRKGIIPPEYIGESQECVEFMLNGLKERGVIYSEKQEIISGTGRK